MTRVKFAGSHIPKFSDSRIGHRDNIKMNEDKFDSGKRIPACVEIVNEEKSYEINEGAVIPEAFYLNIIDEKLRDECGRNSSGIKSGYLACQEIGNDPTAKKGDVRAVSVQDLHTKVWEASALSETQRKALFEMLLQYKDNFTSKPGKCKDFEHRFEVEQSGPTVGRTRPVPFSLRSVVRTQIEQLLDDGLIEYSNSCHLNPLTIVLRDGTSPRICVGARRVSQLTMSDRARVPTVQELLKQFYGSVYMTSIDLSSAFLQIGLHPE
jgi:hypothetical protein